MGHSLEQWRGWRPGPVRYERPRGVERHVRACIPVRVDESGGLVSFTEMSEWIIARVHRVYGSVFSSRVLETLERAVVTAAILGFVLHLAIIAIAKRSGGELNLAWFSSSYLSALYTPFSFLLFFETILLVRALPESFSRSIAIQFEVVALIVVRRVFKDIAHLERVTVLDLGNPTLWEVGADMIGGLVLFVLARRFGARVPAHSTVRVGLRRFVAIKEALSVALGIVVVVLAVASLVEWTIEMFELSRGTRDELGDVNALFYEDFFGLLVLVDVLLLLLSFASTRDTSMVFRNAGFIASTVLVRLSFLAPRLPSLVLMIFAVCFGVVVQIATRTRRLDRPSGNPHRDAPPSSRQPS